jgi:hypothetical protein
VTDLTIITIIVVTIALETQQDMVMEIIIEVVDIDVVLMVIIVTTMIEEKNSSSKRN